MQSVNLPKAYLTARGTEAVRHGHPWVYSTNIYKWEGKPEPGELVEVRTGGARLGFGYANPLSTITIRMLYSPAAAGRGQDDRPDEPVEIFRKLDRAWSRRQPLLAQTDAVRVVWSEADGLPGVICDLFRDVVVAQFLTAGAEARKAHVVAWLASRLKPAGIYERSAGVGRMREGLLPANGWLWTAGAEPPSEQVVIREGALRFQVEVGAGQKTGFYLDQRAARRLLHAQSLSGPALDCFSYTGGFALAAARAGAGSVTAIDSSARALQTLETNADLNGLREAIVPIRAKVFQYLTAAVERKESYSLVILDPPAFARSRAQHDGAMAGYRELHRRAAQLLQPNGWLLSCSCSHSISRKDLIRAALGGVRAAGRRLQVRSEFGPDFDHPEKVQAPESRYLSCVWARVP